jgi:hypothetical protein
VIRFPSAMVYLICILDLVDFEGIRWQMPEGTGIDASLQQRSSTKRKWQKNNKKKNSVQGEEQQLAEAIQGIGNSESSLAALRLMMEIGSREEKPNNGRNQGNSIL